MCRKGLGEFVIRGDSGGGVVGGGEAIAPWSHQLFLQSGARRMFPLRRLWEALLRLWPASQIMMIPVLIRVLWLMFDEQGDRLSGCFYSCFL